MMVSGETCSVHVGQ